MAVRATSLTLSDAARKALDSLAARSGSDAKARSILRRVESLKAALGVDILHGEVVKKPLPPDLVARYGVDNLFVEDLPDFWRLLYTNTRRGSERLLIVLEIVDHAAYDKWFPGRGR